MQGANDQIRVHAVQIPAADGMLLAASLYEPDSPNSAAAGVLIAAACGVKRGYYDAYARFLAERGLIALTFDYRGIGDSRPKTLRGFDASLTDWANKDLGGAIDWFVETRKVSRVLVVAHSIGGQLMGIAPNNARVCAMLTVAAQSGYWGLWSGWRRLFMWFLWYAMMPSLTALLSYFPSKRLGFGEDLPAGVARQWSFWGRHPEYIVDADGNAMRADFRRFRGPLRVYSFSDDVNAPRAAVEALTGWYENAVTESYHLAPSDREVSAIGHFGFFRERFRPSLWSESAQWLLAMAYK